MFEHDNALTIYMYDPKNSDKYQTILIAKDIPSDPSNFAKCIAKAWDSQNRNGTTIVFQCCARRNTVSLKHALVLSSDDESSKSSKRSGSQVCTLLKQMML
jgi:hypothetical protein